MLNNLCYSSAHRHRRQPTQKATCVLNQKYLTPLLTIVKVFLLALVKVLFSANAATWSLCAVCAAGQVTEVRPHTSTSLAPYHIHGNHGGKQKINVGQRQAARLSWSLHVGHNFRLLITQPGAPACGPGAVCSQWLIVQTVQ